MSTAWDEVSRYWNTVDLYSCEKLNASLYSKLMPVWGNFSLNFHSLQSNEHGDVKHVATWYNIQWVICSDNFYEQEKKKPSSNVCHTFWPFSVVHLSPGSTTCFLLWCSICSTWGRNDYSGIQPLVNFSPDVCSRWLSRESTPDPDFLFNTDSLDSNWNTVFCCTFLLSDW